VKRKIITLAFSLFILSNCFSQSIESVYKKYEENKSFRYVSIAKGMINLASLFGKEDAGNKEMLSRVDEMKVLTLKSKHKSKLSRVFFNDIEKALASKPTFVNLMEARENGVHTKVLNRINTKHKTEILIISKSDTVQHFIWLTGNISIPELQQMIKK
jgi:hypothetical protein